MVNIDALIEILQKVKNCDKILHNLKMLEDNLLLNELVNDPMREKWQKHTRSLVSHCINIIENSHKIEDDEE